MTATAGMLRAAAPACRCLLTVWSSRPGDFSARAVMDDGTLRDFDSAFELVRFLTSTAPLPPSESGLR